MKRRKERNLSDLDPPPHYELLISDGVLHHPHPSLLLYLQTHPPK
ncbi:hypothetical protein NC651_007577 [Populus alba x Populus x berolinensis]|nr:hypothetical protein NC651_007577 [Populus alba x Populus x berolinensis]